MNFPSDATGKVGGQNADRRPPEDVSSLRNSEHVERRQNAEQQSITATIEGIRVLASDSMLTGSISLLLTVRLQEMKLVENDPAKFAYIESQLFEIMMTV